MASNNENEFDVFCSYQWDRKSEIENLHANLAEEDLTIWRDTNELRSNNVGLFKQLGENIIKSKVFLYDDNKYTTINAEIIVSILKNMKNIDF